MRRLLLIVFPMVLILWISSGFIVTKIAGYEDRGPFGDMFGAVNALFAGLGLGAEVIILKQQQMQINTAAAESAKNARLANVSIRLQSLNLLLDATNQRLNETKDCQSEWEINQRHLWRDERNYYERAIRQILEEEGGLSFRPQ